MSEDSQAGRRALPGRLVTTVTVGVAAIWLLLDQGTKALAEAALPPPPARINLGVLDLRLVYNEGAAFGIPGFPGLFIGVAVLVIILVARALPRTDRLSLAVAYGLVIGGALGNVTDRIFRPPYFPGGAVVDRVACGQPRVAEAGGETRAGGGPYGPSHLTPMGGGPELTDEEQTIALGYAEHFLAVTEKLAA
jgi:lipoprotein signal peptidase